MTPTQFGVGAGFPRPIAWIIDMGGENPPLQYWAHYFSNGQFRLSKEAPQCKIRDKRNLQSESYSIADWAIASTRLWRWPCSMASTVKARRASSRSASASPI